MHRFILQELLIKNKENMVVDHIDGNGLNNTRKNLRICQQSQNTKNITKLRNKITGIYFDRSRNKWTAEIKVNYKKIFLGRYSLYEEAVYVRFLSEIFKFKEFRNINNNKNIYIEISKIPRFRKLELREYVKKRVL